MDRILDQVRLLKELKLADSMNSKTSILLIMAFVCLLPAGCGIDDAVKDFNQRIDAFTAVADRAVGVADRRSGEFLILAREALAKFDMIWEGLPEKMQQLSRIMGQEFELSVKKSIQHAEHVLVHRLRVISAAIKAERARNPGKKINGPTLDRILTEALQQHPCPPFVDGLGTTNYVELDPSRTTLTLNFTGSDLLVPASRKNDKGDVVGPLVRMVAGNHLIRNTERELSGVPFANSSFTGVAHFVGIRPEDNFVGVRYGDKPFEVVRVYLTRPPTASPVIIQAQLEFKTDVLKSTMVHIDLEATQDGKVVHISDPQVWPPLGFTRIEDQERMKNFWKQVRNPVRGFGYPEVPVPWLEFIGRAGEKIYEDNPHYSILRCRPSGDPGEYWLRVYFVRGPDGPYDGIGLWHRDQEIWCRSLKNNKSGLFCGVSADSNTPELVHELPVGRLDLTKPLTVKISSRGTREWKGCRVTLRLKAGDGREYTSTSVAAINLKPNSPNSSVSLLFDFPKEVAKKPQP